MTSHALYGLLRDLILARNAVPKIADFHDRFSPHITQCARTHAHAQHAHTAVFNPSNTTIAIIFGRLEVDVLITGCEASLWIGEQFASDLQNLFPALRVVAMSANKVIGNHMHFCIFVVLYVLIHSTRLQHFLARLFECITWLTIQCISTFFQALVCFEASKHASQR